VQGGYAAPRRAKRDGGTCFCSHGRILSEVYECRDTSLIDGREIVPVDEFDKWALVQYRGTNCHGARNLSWCRFLIAGRCAYPGVTTITNLSWVQKQKQKP
jgi:hypothetical protein